MTTTSPATGRTPVAVLLDAAARRAVPVVRGIADDELTAPTPCADYDVRALLDHLHHVVVQFQQLAAKKDADFSTTPSAVRPDTDWRAAFARETGALVEAWAAPGAEEGTSGQMGMPARTVAHMALLDLTVHAWDLAAATGQPYEADPAVVGELLGAVAAMAPQAREYGVFGPEVPPPGHATELDRVLALTGRSPRWRP
ncbi:TIGR03086 family metal-binding protein [Streptomyces sp. NPDC059459]|uniref:TIGR03086 family metal-binding protein n=1 Tax=Streptomyces sp. NPDC059459 TaxID=3346839 RepID=UPI00368960A5